MAKITFAHFYLDFRKFFKFYFYNYKTDIISVSSRESLGVRFMNLLRPSINRDKFNTRFYSILRTNSHS
jgi:hypothetical protein